MGKHLSDNSCSRASGKDQERKPEIIVISMEINEALLITHSGENLQGRGIYLQISAPARSLASSPLHQFWCSALYRILPSDHVKKKHTRIIYGPADDPPCFERCLSKPPGVQITELHRTTQRLTATGKCHSNTKRYADISWYLRLLNVTLCASL